VGWVEVYERERGRYEATGKLVLRGNAAYGAGLALLMAGRPAEAGEWLHRAAASWRESWADATPTSWGRPIGAVKALLLAGDEPAAAAAAGWALSLGCEGAESPIGRYAAALALLTLGRLEAAGAQAASLLGLDDFPEPVAAAIAAIAARDVDAAGAAAAAVLASFETRDEYLEDVAVADTVLVLRELARRSGLALEQRASPLLPAA
jgi:hypothetical protein